MKPGLLKRCGPDPCPGVFQFPDRDFCQRVDCLYPGRLPAESLQGLALYLLLPEDSGKIRLQSLKPADQLVDLVKIRSV